MRSDGLVTKWPPRSFKPSPSRIRNPALSPNDEFADFESGFKGLIGTLPNATGRIDYSFVRQALINGLGHQIELGVNPFKFGIVAGADSHTAYSVNEEFNYTGVHNTFDKSPKIRLDSGPNSTGASSLVLGTAGATGVWADENTREAIFDAMVRKETYGTSGTLIRLRLFGGWGYPESMADAQDFAKQGYAGGVPMGGDLPTMPAKAKAPTFAVRALKDPESGNLDRIQIIKGWHQNGHGHERIYDVAWSDNRKPDPTTGKLPPVGNTVNIREATYTNSIGDTQLSAVWSDPDFDPAFHAVYYVRVLEIPTPRWSTYDAKKPRCCSARHRSSHDPGARLVIAILVHPRCVSCHARTGRAPPRSRSFRQTTWW